MKILSSRHIKAIIAVTIIVLMVFACIPAPAEAASAKYSAGIPGYGVNDKTKIGDGYFWFQSSKDQTAKILYYSAKKSANSKKVKLASYSNDEYHMGGRILYNGSKVYYYTYNLAANNYDHTADNKVRIHSVSDTGKNRKTVKTFSTKGFDTALCLLKVYNGRLYFSRTDITPDTGETDYRLCSMSLETKKVTTHKKDFPVDHKDNVSGSSRYIYGYSFTDGGIKVFDCKTKKVVRTIEGEDPVAGSSYMIYRAYNAETSSYDFYKASVSGKNPELILELPSNASSDLYTTSKIYFMDYTFGAPTYYVYHIKDNNQEMMTEADYAEAVGWY